MTKKRPLSSSQKLNHPSRFRSNVVIYLCFLFCFLAYLRLHSQFKLHFSPSSASHATRSFTYHHFVGNPKIAFLFLARRNLPLDFLWGAFFKNGGAANFTIYVHSEPGFVFNETTTSSAFFYGRQLNNSIQAAWGESSMIGAEKLLFEAALHDPANQRFVLLSDSCVPLYNFSYIYNYVISSPKSFVDSFINVMENRYTPKMKPVITKDKWRKGSQWISLIRRHAEIIVNDHTVFPVFKEFCKRWPAIELTKPRKMLQTFVRIGHNAGFQKDLLPKLPKKRNCIPDEHYVQTLLTINGVDNELERRTLTYTLWNGFVTKGHIRVRSWHPVTFNYTDAAPQRINQIKAIDHIDRESKANPTEWCYVNHRRRTHCFLFARKFTRGAAMRLMTQGFVGLYDPAAMQHQIHHHHEILASFV